MHLREIDECVYASSHAAYVETHIPRYADVGVVWWRDAQVAGAVLRTHSTRKQVLRAVIAFSDAGRMNAVTFLGKETYSRAHGGKKQ